MKQERWKPSVTVAAVIEHEGRFLMVEEETSEGLMFNQPAGHLDPGESPQQGVVREALEETARHFVPEALLGLYMARFQRPARQGRDLEDVTYLRLAFCGSVGEPVPGLALDQGIVRTLWMSVEELRACADRHRSPLVMRCVEDYLAGRRLPLEALVIDGSLYEPWVKGA
ncbi:NUDIX hydrolase [Paucibacter sp. APW11]|uniref:Phosphatase NudJ n=1 Tax=Roseateles aquae TaxID=3077235 RepID=A0ABU3PF22_9BURK|nr:NUDIX hydrolase [Paucibacter sp. APW11]MDT9000897.1 NUDIX hydrolase [Paucibacter sp. APW11]